MRNRHSCYIKWIHFNAVPEPNLNKVFCLFHMVLKNCKFSYNFQILCLWCYFGCKCHTGLAFERVLELLQRGGHPRTQWLRLNICPINSPHFCLFHCISCWLKTKCEIPNFFVLFCILLQFERRRDSLASYLIELQKN